MRAIWKELFAAVLMGMILPGVLLNGAVYFQCPDTAQTPEQMLPPPVSIYI